MARFRGKRKKGYTLTLYKKPYQKPNSPTKSPAPKRGKLEKTPTPTACKSPRATPTSHGNTPRKNLFSYNDLVFDEFEDKDPNIEHLDSPPRVNDIFKALPELLISLGKKGDTLIKFFHLLKDNKYPTDNIALSLFLETVEWFSKSDVRQMRYSDETMKFFWTGRKLFGGRLIRFLSGMKNEACLLSGTGMSPSRSINFAVPSENALREIHPLGDMFEREYPVGIIDDMMKLKAGTERSNTSYVLMFDGKKVKRGGDVDLMGFESGPSLHDRVAEKDTFLSGLDEAIRSFEDFNAYTLQDTPEDARSGILKHILAIFRIVSENIKKLRSKKKNLEIQHSKLREKAEKEPGKTSLTYAVDMCRCRLYQIQNTLQDLISVQWKVCKAGSAIQNKQHLYAKGKYINMQDQENIQLLPTQDGDSNQDDRNVDTTKVKQHTQQWHSDRAVKKVTGSTIYGAIGCDGLKRQQEHFDKVIYGKVPPEPSTEAKMAMKHGVDNEVNEIATLASVVLPFLYPDTSYKEVGYYKNDELIVSPDGLLVKDGVPVYAFEGKAPVGNIYTTPVHYKVPIRYITQTVMEQKDSDAQNGTLYLCWSKESTTVFEIPRVPLLCEKLEREIQDVYYSDITTRPSRISKPCKEIAEIIKDAPCKFVGEFPSVFGTNRRCPETETSEPMSYNELLASMIRGQEAIKMTYDFLREHASQVLVYLLADLDRMWKPEEPHAVPVLYCYRGYSLTMEVARAILEHCKRSCWERGLDVIVSSSDGEFINMIVRGKAGNPLTQHELSKDVWSEVTKLSKSRLVKAICELGKNFQFITEDDKLVLFTEDGFLRTPSNGWTSNKKRHGTQNVKYDDTNMVTFDGVQDEESSEVFETHFANTALGDEDIVNLNIESAEPYIGALEDQESDDYPHSDMEESQHNTNDSSQGTVEELDHNNDPVREPVLLEEKDLIELKNRLTASKSKRNWFQINTIELGGMLKSSSQICKLTKLEITEITKYINNAKASPAQRMTVTGLLKHDMANQLSVILIGVSAGAQPRKQVYMILLGL